MPPPLDSRTSRPTQRSPESGSTAAGRVCGCQVRSTYASSSSAKALYRERINASAVAGGVPRWAGPQHSAYGRPRPQGHAVTALVRLAMLCSLPASSAGLLLDHDRADHLLAAVQFLDQALHLLD